MARTISDEELQLRRRARRRLIGAVVLVTAVVVVLPMVLDSEPKPAGQPISVQIPSPDSGGFAPKLAPPTPQSAPEPVKTAPAPPAKTAAETPANAAAAAPPPAQEAAPPVAAAPKDAPAKPRPKAKPAAKAKGGQYVVQVIALADAGKAGQMQQQIAGAGIKSYTEVVKTAKGDVTRVRAGPFATRSAAEKAREQLKALGMNGNITTK